MRNFTFFWALLAITLCSCNSKKTHPKVGEVEEKTVVPKLADSQIPASVIKTILSLEENGLIITTISHSKWSLFGEAGIWLKTDKGSVDIVPIAEHIDRTKIKVTQTDSNTVDFYVYELKYKGVLEQSLQGHQTYFTIGNKLIYKTLDKELHDEIMQVEFK